MHMIECDVLKTTLNPSKFNVRRGALTVCSALSALVILFASGTAIAQGTDPGAVTRVKPPSLEEGWRTKLNAVTMSIIAGTPSETYLEITHDLAVVLNDDSLRVRPDILRCARVPYNSTQH
jgi:hypothetical protein